MPQFSYFSQTPSDFCLIYVSLVLLFNEEKCEYLLEGEKNKVKNVWNGKCFTGPFASLSANLTWVLQVNVVNPAMHKALLLLEKFAVDTQSGKIPKDKLRFGAPWRHPPKTGNLSSWAKVQLMDFVQSLVNAEFGVF